MNKKLDNVNQAVWLAAAILSYERYLENKEKNNSEYNFWLRQNEIQSLAQQLCSSKVHSARISQWFNGDHPNHTYKYLRSKDAFRRLTAKGEFGGDREEPSEIDINNVVDISSGKSLSVKELKDWIINIYTPLIINKIFENKVKDNKEILINPIQRHKLKYTTEIGSYIKKFWQLVNKKNIEIYNEFSLQHELGVFLRNNLRGNIKVQFERNVRCFDINKQETKKKEIDISIFNDTKDEKYCIELKYPNNGQIPEQMFSFCKDIKFLEQLVEKGFAAGYFVALVESDAYFLQKSVSENEIYKIFRDNKLIEGKIRKPTGEKDEIIEIMGSYPLVWNYLEPSRYYTIIEVKP